ncbi:hypothetical protein DL98DRAFT_267765 [Cadophora sp. DSE1049]|nr:hypothetical protein DL98DRAFT_267765 [Cadophora sp. DSE1049]
MALKMADNSNGSGFSSKKFIWEWMWACCNCACSASMSVEVTLACPECGVYRCENCPLESVKRRVYGLHHRSGNLSNPAPLPEATTSKDVQSRTGSVSIGVPIQQEVETSQSSARESNDDKGPNLTPIPQETELDLSQPNTANELDTKRSIATTEELTTLLATTAEPCCEAKSGISSEKGSQLSANANRKPKLRWKKPRLDVHKPTQTFACHYNKRDPLIYDPRVCKKYRTCLVPSVPVYELRRLKEHFLTAHGPLYCDRCAEPFQKESELLKHNSESESCQYSTEPLLHLEDGISSTQWRAIVESLKEKGLKGFEKETHEISMWEKIWDVLFHGVQRPMTPWVEMPSHPAPILGNIESFIATYKQLTTWKVEQGILLQDSNAARIHEETLRESYDMCLKRMSSLDVDYRSDTKPAPELHWTEQTMFETAVASSPTTCFRKSEDFQSYQMHQTGPADVTSRSGYHFQSSQQAHRSPEAPPRLRVENSLLSASPAAPVSQNTQMWPFNPGFDSNATLLSPSQGEEYLPDCPSDKPLENLDESDLHKQACLSKSTSKCCSTLTAGKIGAPRSSSPIGSNYLQLCATDKSGEYYFSPEDHQLSVAELDELLDTKGTAHVDQQDVG